MTSFTVLCKCGTRIENIKDEKRAQVLADYHEVSARVAHKHDAQVFTVLDIPEILVEVK